MLSTDARIAFAPESTYRELVVESDRSARHIVDSLAHPSRHGDESADDGDASKAAVMTSPTPGAGTSRGIMLSTPQREAPRATRTAISWVRAATINPTTP
jgi:hypothetical protein